MCGSVLQCIIVCCSVSKCVAEIGDESLGVAVYGNVSHCVVEIEN